MIDTEKIIEACAQAWGVKREDIMGTSRLEGIMEPRHYARYIMYRQGMTTNEVARLFQCTHPTVVNSLRRVEHWLHFGGSGILYKHQNEMLAKANALMEDRNDG